MRIAYVGNFSVDFTTETHIAKTLEKLGHEVIRIQEKDHYDPSWKESMPYDIDMFLYTRTWGKMVTLDDLAALKNAGIPTVSYHLDLYVGLQREGGIEYDPFWRTEYVFTADGDPNSVAFFKAKGINHFYLPPGVFEDECEMLEPNDDPRLQGEIIFVGGGAEYGHPEWPYRHELVKHLEERYGDKYKKYGHPQMSVRGRELNQLYANAKIAIGDSVNIGFRHQNYTSDRLYESIGRGAFTIYPRIAGIAETFPRELQSIFYTHGDFADLDAKISYFLRHDTKRESLRRKLFEFVSSSQTYTQRLGAMIEQMTAIGAFSKSEALREAPTREFTIPLTFGFSQDLDDVIGMVSISDTPRAQALWDAFRKSPQSFTLDTGFVKNDDGSSDVTQISLISKGQA